MSSKEQMKGLKYTVDMKNSQVTVKTGPMGRDIFKTHMVSLLQRNFSDFGAEIHKCIRHTLEGTLILYDKESGDCFGFNYRWSNLPVLSRSDLGDDHPLYLTITSYNGDSGLGKVIRRLKEWELRSKKY